MLLSFQVLPIRNLTHSQIRKDLLTYSLNPLDCPYIKVPDWCCKVYSTSFFPWGTLMKENTLSWCLITKILNSYSYSQMLVCIVETFNQPVSEGSSNCLWTMGFTKVEPTLSHCVLNMIHNLFLNIPLLMTQIRTHQLPHCFINFLPLFCILTINNLFVLKFRLDILI